MAITISSRVTVVILSPVQSKGNREKRTEERERKQEGKGKKKTGREGRRVKRKDKEVRFSVLLFVTMCPCE